MFQNRNSTNKTRGASINLINIPHVRDHFWGMLQNPKRPVYPQPPRADAADQPWSQKVWELAHFITSWWGGCTLWLAVIYHAWDGASEAAASSFPITPRSTSSWPMYTISCLCKPLHSEILHFWSSLNSLCGITFMVNINYQGIV